MADIKSFQALRFTEAAGGIEALACPPYDIISEEERAAYLRRNENNIIRLELPRDGDDPYRLAGEELNRMLETGILAEDEQLSLTIYAEQFTAYGQEYSFRGVIAAVRAEPFSQGVILPHEQTLSKAKTDRFNLTCATGCNFSQIYSLFMDDERRTADKLEQLSAGAPDQTFTDKDGVTHSLWRITDEAVINDLCADFAQRKLYIADGHHRYETALNYKAHVREQSGTDAADGELPSDYVMMMLVDMQNPGLVVFPTHRIVRDLPAFDAAELLGRLAGDFTLTDIAADCIEAELMTLYTAGKCAFALYETGGCHLMVLKDDSVMTRLMPDSPPALRALDVSVLHTLVLERYLGIDRENMANQINLTYTKAASEALEAVDAGRANCAFVINPTRVEEIRDVAAVGEKMPQKSTYFYPKLITGMVMRKM